MAEAWQDAAAAAGASTSDLNLIATLRAKAATFSANRAELQRLGAELARKSNDYDLLVEYGRLAERATKIQTDVTTALRWADNSIKAVRGVIGLDGMAKLGDLGVWFLPAAGIAVVLGVIGYWTNDYLKFRVKASEVLRIQRELESEGMDTAAAAREAHSIVKLQDPPSFPTWLVMGALALVTWQLFRS